MAASGADIINKALGTNEPLIGPLLQKLELAWVFAGREQWVRNIQGQAPSEALENVSMVSPVHDRTAKRLLINRFGMSEYDHGRHVAYWKTLVPPWASAVRKTLQASKIPFSVELLASPEINLLGEPPLFELGEKPGSLFQLGVQQAGENGYLRSLGADTLMLEVWPHYYRLHHRGAGKPVPAGYEAGLTFGSPVRQKDGSYLRSPLMSTPSYAAHQANGSPA